MRRVVVTGMGILSPLGRGIKTNWDQLIAGKSGLRTTQGVDLTDLPSKVSGQVPRGKDNPALFDPDLVMAPKDQRRVDTFILFGIQAGMDAVADSGWVPQTEEDHCRTGVLMGAGIGGITAIRETSYLLKDGGPRKVSPFFIPSCIINLISGHLSIKFGFKGPCHAVVTACSTGTHAIGDASRLIMLGDADVMLAGGAEASIDPIAIAGFSQAKALSTKYNDTPEKASRPWDKGRDGFVMGEGSGSIVLEEYEHAKKRGAKIYAEIVGYGLSGDAYHITAPAPDGNGAYRAMQGALKWSKLGVEDIGYVNAHGTSTPLGDELELGAVKRLFGDAAYKTLSMSSTKSSIGHLLGAAGAVEAIYSILGMNNGILPPTLNLDDPSDGCDIDLIPHKAKEKKVKAVMSNSFGFGGTNSSIIFKAV